MTDEERRKIALENATALAVAVARSGNGVVTAGRVINSAQEYEKYLKGDRS